MKMSDWARKLDDFLQLGDHDVLKSAGEISAQQAKEKALIEYDQFRKKIDSSPSQVDRDLEEAIRTLQRTTKSSEKPS